jgi:hypothetical protein
VASPQLKMSRSGMCEPGRVGSGNCRGRHDDKRVLLGFDKVRLEDVESVSRRRK